MKTTIITALLFLLCFSVQAKEYDLIVSSSGDSIACHIDSVTESFVYFKMKNNGRWTQTYTAISDLKAYDYKVIDKKEVKFKPNTSVFFAKAPLNNRNNVYGTLLVSMDVSALQINYERLFYTNRQAFFTEAWLRYGAAYWVSWTSAGPMGSFGLTTLTGKKNHHAEFNLSLDVYFDLSEYNYYQDHEPRPTSDFIFSPLVVGFGYRYQPTRAGLIFRTGVKLYASDYFTASGYISLGKRF